MKDNAKMEPNLHRIIISYSLIYSVDEFLGIVAPLNYILYLLN